MAVPLPFPWADEPLRPVQQTYDLVVPDVLATIYSMEEPVPVPRLAESVWQVVEARFDLDHVNPFILESLRARMDRDVEHIFDAFEALGAVTSVRAMADGLFLKDLADAAASPFDRVRSAALRRQLKDPVRLVALARLGTRAVRERMLVEGREAALVGELAGAAPRRCWASSPRTTRTPAPPRRSPAGGKPTAAHWTRSCKRSTTARSSPGASPCCRPSPVPYRKAPSSSATWPATTVALLARRPELRPPDATPEEATWMMIGTLLELLELGGPEAVTEQLSQFPPGQRNELARTVLASGFPVPETLEEFRTLVAAPILHGPPQPHPTAHGTRTQRTRPKRRRRH
jgi:hypothetical protein